MAEMRLARGAAHLGADHAVRAIDDLLDRSLVHRPEKLGQPVPESNLVSERKSGVPQATQR